MKVVLAVVVALAVMVALAVVVAVVEVVEQEVAEVVKEVGVARVNILAKTI